MRVLVSGGSGLLGRGILRHCEERGYSCDQLDRSKVDWTGDPSGNRTLLLDYDFFIHCAANTNVEDCEVNALQCYKDNALLTKKMVMAAKGLKIKFVYVSSTGVYGKDVLHRPYTGDDIPNPTTVHHKSKYRGEQYVAGLSDHLIVRVGWLFGAERGKQDFITKIKSSALNTKGPIKANFEQVGVPTYVPDAVCRLFDFLEADERGVFNLVSSGRASRYEYVKAIVEAHSIDAEVVPCVAAEFKRLAPVSNNESAVCRRQIGAGYLPMRHWREALTHHIKFGS